MSRRTGSSGGAVPAWAALLARLLAPGDWRRLRELSRGWRVNPFAVDEDSGRFEISEAWERQRGHAPLKEEDLDLLLRACDLLAEHRAELGEAAAGMERVAPAGGDEHGAELEFRFALSPGSHPGGDGEVARRFVALLQEEPAFRVEQEDLGEVRRVTVRFSFRNDFEYHARKSRVDWLLELARRLRQDRPFLGWRV